MTSELLWAVVLLPLAGWVMVTLLFVKNAVMELRTVLIGMDGQNGMRSTLNHLETQLTQHEHRLTVLETHRSHA